MGVQLGQSLHAMVASESGGGVLPMSLMKTSWQVSDNTQPQKVHRRTFPVQEFELDLSDENWCGKKQLKEVGVADLVHCQMFHMCWWCVGGSRGGPHQLQDAC